MVRKSISLVGNRVCSWESITMLNKKILLLIFTLQILIGQTYQVGDIVNDFASPICQNGEGEWSYNVDGRNKVVWINLFTSW